MINNKHPEIQPVPQIEIPFLGKSLVGSPDICLFGMYDPDIQGINFSRQFRINWSCILFLMFRRGTSDIPPPGFNGFINKKKYFQIGWGNWDFDHLP